MFFKISFLSFTVSSYKPYSFLHKNLKKCMFHQLLCGLFESLSHYFLKMNGFLFLYYKYISSFFFLLFQWKQSSSFLDSTYGINKLPCQKSSLLFNGANLIKKISDHQKSSLQVSRFTLKFFFMILLNSFTVFSL